MKKLFVWCRRTRLNLTDAVSNDIVKCAMHTRPFSPPLGEGEVMSGWCLDWQTAVAWVMVTAIATVIYFVPMTRLIDFGN